MKSKAAEWHIGDRVSAPRHYGRRAAARFAFQAKAKEPVPVQMRDKRDLPRDKPIRGLVVGKRSVVMADYERVPFRNGYSFETEEVTEEMPHTTGRKETVLLVARNINQEPVIVRLCDAVREEKRARASDEQN